MNKRISYKIVIIGGGASGMTAAIAALEENKRLAGKVLLLESNDRVGKKLLATGNGKCNFTHEAVSPDAYHTDDEAALKKILGRFPTEATVQFFERLGMLSKNKNGYFYPMTETASTVLDVLRLRMEELGCVVQCGVKVEEVRRENNCGYLVKYCRRDKSMDVKNTGSDTEACKKGNAKEKATEEDVICCNIGTREIKCRDIKNKARKDRDINNKKDQNKCGSIREELLVHTDCIILATGSKAGGFLQDKTEDPLRLAEKIGLQATPLYPALTKCICRENFYKGLAGVRAQVKLTLYKGEYPGKFPSVENVGKNGKISDAENSANDGKSFDDTAYIQERGELQLTKEGISGIVVFQLSGDIAEMLAEGKRVIVEINFLPDFPEDGLEDWAKKRLLAMPGRSLEDFFLGVLHKKVLYVCLQREGLKPSEPIADVGKKRSQSLETIVGIGKKRSQSHETIAGKGQKRMQSLETIADIDQERMQSFGSDAGINQDMPRLLEKVIRIMKRAMHFTTEVTSVSDMKQAQVCRGGLCLSQFGEGLECKTMPGLFACGEMLNVDGLCGGYNLHFAWASGSIAGKEAAHSCCKG